MIRPVRRGVHWSPEEDTLLRALASAGESVANIAKRINRSRKSILARAAKLNVALVGSPADTRLTEQKQAAQQRWTVDEDVLLRQMLDQKMVVEDIATRLGRTPYAVYSRLQRIYRYQRPT